MARRFYLPSLDADTSVRLEGREARHLARVLRARPGDIVTLFDGAGGEADACVIRVDRDLVEFAVHARRKIEEPSHRPATLAVAPPKGDRFAWLVEKATELGIDRLVPLVTERSVVEPGAGKLEKLRKTIVEASKQSGRSRLMDLTDPIAWQQFLEEAEPDRALFVAHAGGTPLSPADLAGPTPLVFAVGPEGGFTDDELQRATNCGARLVSLGPNVLRIETAALALAACAAISGVARKIAAEGDDL